MKTMRKTLLIRVLSATAALVSLSGCATIGHLDGGSSAAGTEPSGTQSTQKSGSDASYPCSEQPGSAKHNCGSSSANSSVPAAMAETPDNGSTNSNLANPNAGAPDSSSPDESTASPSSQKQTVWTDIRAGFQLPDDLNQPLVQNAIAFYRQHPAYLERVTARAEPYLYYILQQIHKRHMPTELALLPVVESAYIPYAYSSCRAAGIWQFTPSTGRHFGLKQNWWYDGRRDIYASTKAALDYLQSLHAQFGSWLLALAAYNSGAGTVEWAIKRNQERHKPTDFWALDLPQQTKTYVPKLLAVRAIVDNPNQYNVSLWPIPDKPYLAAVHLKSQIDLSLAAKLAGIKLSELYILNPGYNRWATDPNGPHRLLLPADTVKTFEEKLASIPTSHRVTWIRYRVRSGETLSQIASTYHTSVKVIRRSNHLHGNLIRVGQHLIIPHSASPYIAYARAENMHPHAVHAVFKKSTKQYHVVKSGDTLWDIAREYHVNVSEIQRWNHLTKHSNLRPGQHLVIWTHSSIHSTAPTRVASVRSNIDHSEHAAGYHIIRSGDTLWDIARNNNVSVSKLRHWNHLSKHSKLHPGQRIIIRRNNNSPHTQLASNNTTRVSASSSGHTRYHVVKSGDTLWDIAQTYNVSVSDLMHWNHLTKHSDLHPGQKIIIRTNKQMRGLAVARNNEPSQRVRTVSYTVHSGDSLYSIAQRFGVNIHSIRRWNNLGKTNLLHPGQPLKLRVDVTQTNQDG